jgi:ATP-dependent DNA ligase
MMSLTDWVEQKTFITMRQNRAYLELVLKDCKKISVTVGREVTDYQDMMTYCNEAIDIHKVEGLILKDYNSPYTWDRSFSWTKCKRFYDVDCKIVGFYNGRPKSRLENTLGGIEVVGFLEDGTRVEARVGSGFSDELRAEIWQNQAKWLDKPAVVIKYQEVSRAKNKAVASLRFPTFERERDDKLVEI